MVLFVHLNKCLKHIHIRGGKLYSNRKKNYPIRQKYAFIYISFLLSFIPSPFKIFGLHFSIRLYLDCDCLGCEK